MRKLQAAKRQTRIFRQGLSDKDKRKHHYTHDDRSRHPYGMTRKIFEEKIQVSKKTYAEIAGKFIDDLAKHEANKLQAIKEKRLNTEKILQEEEEENTKLKATIEKLMRIREENANLKQQIASMESGQKKTSRQKQPSLKTKFSQQNL
jgi:Mg2+ and Co2+ transporter CorA